MKDELKSLKVFQGSGNSEMFIVCFDGVSSDHIDVEIQAIPYNETNRAVQVQTALSSAQIRAIGEYFIKIADVISQ